MRINWRLYFLPAVTFATMLIGLYMIAFYAPIESEMGIVQKIFYFHVPLAWNAFLAFFLVCVYSFAYLRTRKRNWDMMAHASAEVGMLYCSLVLITGPIWAKPVWGIWWTWDARLTLTLVLWLIYAAYLMLRHYVDQPEKRATLSAVVGIVGFLDVPLVYFSIRWWRTQHPQPVIAGGPDSGLDPMMANTLYVCAFAFFFLFLYLVRRRVALQRLRDIVDALQQKMDAMSRSGKGATS